jgi:hypothetical protein
MTRSTMALMACVTLRATVASGQTASDVEAWPSVAVTTGVGERVEIRADGLLQITDALSRVSRELLRVVVVTKLNETTSLGAGYTWTRVGSDDGGRFVEQRAVQQIELRVPAVALRARLEERRQRFTPGTAVRLRLQGRFDVPLGAGRPRAVVWSEYFHGLNATRWSGPAGPRLVLSFVGIHVPLTRRTAVEPGYINQTTLTAGRNDTQHALAVFVVTRLRGR